MGILIRIRKYDEYNHIFRYKVHGEDCGGTTFYMDIDTNEKILKFYKKLDDRNPIATVDLVNLDQPLPEIPEIINSYMLSHVIVKGYKAFKNNDFSLAIDYAA